jgi:uncharacterized membrane protein
MGTCSAVAVNVQDPMPDIPALFASTCVLVVLAAAASLAAASAHERWSWSHEELDITGDVLTHRAAGRSPGILRLLFTKDFKEGPVDKEALGEAGILLERGRSVHILRRYVERIELQGRGFFEVLALVLRDRDINVGRSLSDEEREWLASVLRRWHDAGQLAPGSTGA